ncbi:MAG TPA: hypothetical protein VFU02_02585 [Polyangiaceae bacterium]|nr:hypothetical protein [Polyangiaceae bacterium]
MADEWVETGPGFWNIRGSLKLAGFLEVGTQMSAVRLSTGKFALLDSYTPDPATQRRLLELTDGGNAVESVVNLHPFHTLHVAALAELFPNAKLYGTARHVARFPQLNWEKTRTESSALGELFSEDLKFSVPAGVDFVPQNQRLHFASVLAFHPASGTLHVDDTLTWINLPLIGGLRFHPALPGVLQRRPGAVREFRAWLSELRTLFAEVKTVCPAHMKTPPPNDGQWQRRLDRAIGQIDEILDRHERKYGSLVR